jgi:hypothetical protein
VCRIFICKLQIFYSICPDVSPQDFFLLKKGATQPETPELVDNGPSHRANFSCPADSNAADDDNGANGRSENFRTRGKLKTSGHAANRKLPDTRHFELLFYFGSRH